MTPAPKLQDLITEVQQDAAADSPMDRLRAAAELVAGMNEMADATLGYFVDGARFAGHSWTEIGEALGVTKQAAQQRHVVRRDVLQSVTFERFTDRARKVVAAAEPAARELGHGYVGTEHLLLAQFSEPGAIAGLILTEAGMTEAGVRAAIAAVEPSPGPAGTDALSYTPKAVESMTTAFQAALELGHNYIGTEHLLLGQARTPAMAADILKAAGLDEAAVKAKVAEKLAGFTAK